MNCLYRCFCAFIALGERKKSSAKDCDGNDIKSCFTTDYFLLENSKQRDCYGFCSWFFKVTAAYPDSAPTRDWIWGTFEFTFWYFVGYQVLRSFNLGQPLSDRRSSERTSLDPALWSVKYEYGVDEKRKSSYARRNSVMEHCIISRQQGSMSLVMINLVRRTAMTSFLTFNFVIVHKHFIPLSFLLKLSLSLGPFPPLLPASPMLVQRLLPPP